MKKNYLTKVLLFFTALFVISCSDDLQEVEQKSLHDNEKVTYLKFENSDDLKAAMKEYHKSENKEEVVHEIVKTYTVNSNLTDFRSFQDYKSNLELTDSKHNVTSTFRSLGGVDISADSLGNLVPDPAFASVLNEDLEIVVGNNLYKITPYGTFFTKVDNQEKLNSLLENGYSSNTEQMVEEKLYAVTDEIFRYDTYAPNRVEPIDPGTGGGGGGYSPPPPPPPTSPTPPPASPTCDDYYQPLS